MTVLTEVRGEAGARSVQAVSAAELRELLGVSQPTLADLKRRGIAVHLRHDAYDMGATVRAYVEHLRGVAAGRGGEQHVAGLTAERARLAREQADGQALKNAQARGELVRAGEVERAWADILRQVRAGVLAVPSRLRADMGLAADVADAIDRALRAALVQLGEGGEGRS